MRRTVSPIHAFAVAVALALVCGGCRSGHKPAAGDKAGRSAPVFLELASISFLNNQASPLLQQFADRVAALSGNSVRVRVVDPRLGPGGPEQQVARAVRDGKYDLGWISAPAWDELGVTSLQALQTPFLITSYRLMDDVARSSLAQRMLDGLGSYQIVGLALVPDALQHPKGEKRAFVAPGDYAGARLFNVPSRATDDLVAALGATPVHGFGSTFDGQPWPLEAGGHGIATGNVVLLAKLSTLFANKAAFERLSDDQRRALQTSARELVGQAIARTPSDQAAARIFCQNGAIAMASRADLAALEQAARPVTAKLERDSETKDLIEEIRKLKASAPPGRPLMLPPGCRREPRPTALRGTRLSASILDGTYRYTLTKAAAEAFGDPVNRTLDEYPVVSTWYLRDGKWATAGPEGDEGSYTITGNRIAIYTPRLGYTDTFTFARDANGTLHLKPVLPMDRGDQFFDAGAPWQRIGPPVK